MPVTVRSFAKINLGLRIGVAREDGFHQLLTVYQTIGLHDVIRVSAGRGSGIEIHSEDPRVPRDESNTCHGVVARALLALGVEARVTIEIEKRLPVQGGLGGASANAVATLLGLERALRKTMSASERMRIAAEVGSDLPLFLVGGTVLGVGRGEQVFPLPDLPAMPCVVVTPDVGVSTPKAFAAWDRMIEEQGGRPSSASRRGRSSRVMRADGVDQGHSSAGDPLVTEPPKLTRADTSDRMNKLGRGLSAWLSEMYSSAPFGRGRAGNPLLWLVRAGIENDFEQVVFPEYPKLREGKRAVLRAGAKYASLSGSGSTLYGLFESKEAAGKAAARLQKEGWAAQATSTLTRASYWRRVVVE